MYKAGDFTGGKMNAIFKAAAKQGEDIGKCGAEISHKQFGGFTLISEESFAIKSCNLYCIISGSDIHSFYSEFGDGTDGADARQLTAVNDLLFSKHLDMFCVTWKEAYFNLVGRLGAIIGTHKIDISSYHKRKEK